MRRKKTKKEKVEEHLKDLENERKEEPSSVRKYKIIASIVVLLGLI